MAFTETLACTLTLCNLDKLDYLQFSNRSILSEQYQVVQIYQYLLINVILPERAGGKLILGRIRFFTSAFLVSRLLAICQMK